VAAGATARRLRCVLAVIAVATLAALLACAETRRSFGEECLKGDDCLSSICAGMHCAAAPPLLDGEPADIAVDASGDAQADVQGDAPAMDAADTMPDSSPDAPDADGAGGDAGDG
jgi:hypothetical protein